MEIKKVGVLGCGLMGSGIALVSASSGYETVIREADETLAEKGLEKISKTLDKAAARGRITETEKAAVSSRLQATINLEALDGCDLVIEAITEDLALKREMFSALDSICGADAIFASNTSSIKIGDIASATGRPERFVGLHFFNPVPVMKLVEVVRTEATTEGAFGKAFGFVESLGKKPVACGDTTGFVVNRLLVPYLLDAIRALEAGVASRDDIDKAMKLGCGYPMGPLTLLDFVGLDTTLYIAGIMSDEFKLPQYEAPELLRKMVDEGKLGKKSGEGFYKYMAGGDRPS